MNHYETVFIATPVLSDVQTKEVFGKFQGVITENGGRIVSGEEWGLKKLAYPIQKKAATAVKRARHLALLPFVTDMFK